MENKDNVILPPEKTDYRYGCAECGELAYWKNCFQAGENKGVYSPGRGYTKYFDKPVKVCMQRFLNGCPRETCVYDKDPGYAKNLIQVIPAPDAEKFEKYLNHTLYSIKASQKVKNFIKFLIRTIMFLLKQRKQLVDTNNTLRKENKCID